jgi:hypothetical protein
MVTIAGSKSNHYERLGLAPDASGEEIARAFALRMSPLMPRSVRDLAEIALAFETLRDPVKRRAYDTASAPPREPEPKAMFPREGWPIVASARVGSAELPAIDSLPRAPATVEPVQPKPAFEEPVRTDPLEPFRYVEPGPVNWKRPAVVIGGLFASVAAIGAGLGWYASRGIDPAQARPAVTFPVPRTGRTAVEAPPPPAPKKAEPKGRVAKPRAATRRAGPAPVLSEAKRAEDVPDIPSEQVAALASSAAAEVPAAMPLPDAVIARTIGRIGYACGEVASTSAVEGASGVFKVTCTSGDSYRAAPVRGRYHFKRWSGG